MEDLQSTWQVPAIAYFCSLFKDALHLIQFEIEELEVALLETNADAVSPLLVDLLVRLLKGCYHRNDINSENYTTYLHDIVKCRWHQEDKHQNLLQEPGSSFGSLSLRSRVDILLALCDYRLTADDAGIIFQECIGDNLRLKPIGYGADGSSFWYFYGTRLYKESTVSTPSSANKSIKLQSVNKKSVSLSKVGMPVPGKAYVRYCIGRSCWGSDKKYLQSNRIKCRDLAPLSAEKTNINCININSSRRITRSSLQEKTVIQVQQYKSSYAVRGEEATASNAGGSARSADCPDNSDVGFRRKSGRLKKTVERLTVGNVHQNHCEEMVGRSARKKAIQTLDCRRSSRKKKWKLICDSYADWITFVESLSTTVKCEASLARLIRSNFLDEIKSLCAEKARTAKNQLRLRRRETEMTVDPISIRISTSCRSTHHRNGSHVADLVNAHEAEVAVSLQELERRRVKEERLQRYQMREKRLSQLAVATNMSDFTKSLANENKLRSDLTAILKALHVVKQHPDAWPFIDKVDERFAPCYYEIIKEPMSIRQIESKLRNCKYESVESAVGDFRRIVENSCTYNGADSEYTVMAKTVFDHFSNLVTNSVEATNTSVNCLVNDPPVEDSLEVSKFVQNKDLVESDPSATAEQRAKQKELDDGEPPSQNTSCSSATDVYLQPESSAVPVKGCSATNPSDVPVSSYECCFDSDRNFIETISVASLSSQSVSSDRIREASSTADVMRSGAISSIVSTLTTSNPDDTTLPLKDTPCSNPVITSNLPLKMRFRKTADSVVIPVSVPVGIPSPPEEPPSLSSECRLPLPADFMNNGIYRDTRSLSSDVKICQFNNIDLQPSMCKLPAFTAVAEGLRLKQYDSVVVNVTTVSSSTCGLAKTCTNGISHSCTSRGIEPALIECVASELSDNRPLLPNGSNLVMGENRRDELCQGLQTPSTVAVVPNSHQLNTQLRSSVTKHQCLVSSVIGCRQQSSTPSIAGANNLGTRGTPKYHQGSQCCKNTAIDGVCSTSVGQSSLSSSPFIFGNNANRSQTTSSFRFSTSDIYSRLSAAIADVNSLNNVNFLNHLPPSFQNDCLSNIISNGTAGRIIPRPHFAASTFVGLPLPSELVRDNGSWLSQSMYSSEPRRFGQGFLQQNPAMLGNHTHFLSGSTVHHPAPFLPDSSLGRAAAAAAAASRRQACSLSPLILHSPRSMSPRLPLLQSSRTCLPASTLPAMNRLTIAIPPRSPTSKSYCRQRIGEGILTTRPPHSVIVGSAQNANANNCNPLLAGGITGPGLFFWPRPTSVLNFGSLQLPPSSC